MQQIIQFHRSSLCNLSIRNNGRFDVAGYFIKATTVQTAIRPNTINGAFHNPNKSSSIIFYPQARSSSCSPGEVAFHPDAQLILKIPPFRLFGFDCADKQGEGVRSALTNLVLCPSKHCAVML